MLFFNIIQTTIDTSGLSDKIRNALEFCRTGVILRDDLLENGAEGCKVVRANGRALAEVDCEDAGDCILVAESLGANCGRGITVLFDLGSGKFDFQNNRASLSIGLLKDFREQLIEKKEAV